MKDKDYLLIGLVLLLSLYFITKPSGEPVSLKDTEVFLNRQPSSNIKNTKINNNQTNALKSNLKIKKPMVIKLNKARETQAVSCEELSLNLEKDFYEKNKDELDVLIGSWFFNKKDDPVKRLSLMSNAEKYYYAMLRGGFLISSLDLLKNINEAKEIFNELYYTDTENAAYILPLYILEDDEKTKKDYLMRLYASRSYKTPLEEIYNKIFSLVESGEDYLGAFKLFSQASKANLSSYRKTLKEKRMYFIAMYMANNILDDDLSIKDPNLMSEYKLAKEVMDHIYKENKYESAFNLMKEYIQDNKRRSEAIADMHEDCDPDVIWSLVHDDVKTRFQ